MTQTVYYIILSALLVLLELGYFQFAKRFHIVDIPNDRSSHHTIVIRGGGIIFPLAMIVYSFCFQCHLPWLLLGVCVISIISFWDDIHSLPNYIRLCVQALAIGCICIQLSFMQSALWWLLPLVLFVGMGVVNMFNFMDGINGILGGYSAVVLLSLLGINQQILFTSNELLITLVIADMVFCFFNFRPSGHAQCFCGDVGALSIAFLIFYFLFQLVLTTHDVTWFVLIALFGMDTSLTIVHRILLHEHLGQAHRKHAFQLMANELHLSHILVSGIYMAVQAVISLVFIYWLPNTLLAHAVYIVAVVLLLAAGYWIFMKKYYILHQTYLDHLNH